MNTRYEASDIVKSVEGLLESWDEAAKPDENGCHDGGGFAMNNWILIRADLRWLLAHIDVLEATR